MTKKEQLDELKEKMEKDENLPLKASDTNLVFGVGNPEAKILCLGEGPGYWENLKKEPFVGNAGKLLDRLLASVSIPRESVYITNVVHHRPPENRDPEPSEISAYGKYLDEIIRIINPKVIVTLGRFSMGKFLPGVMISGVHGKKFDVIWNGKNIIVVPMYHPAAALRRGEVMLQIKNDFLKLPSFLAEIESKIEVEQTQLF
jgi:uracil-DNA glycosylase